MRALASYGAKPGENRPECPLELGHLPGENPQSSILRSIYARRTPLRSIYSTFNTTFVSGIVQSTHTLFKMATASSHHQHHLSHPSHPSDSEDFFSPDPRNRDPSLPPPPPSDRSDAAINLSVLKRYLPSAQEILEKAPYAVVYIYGAGSEGKEPGWEKTGVEGTVFVLRLLDDDHNSEYAVMVLNRRGLDNWVLHLKSHEGVQLTEEYVILQGTGDEDEKVYGLWIYDQPDKSTRGLREIIGNCIVDCAEKAAGIGQDEESEQYEQSFDHSNGSNGQLQSQTASQDSPDLMAILNPPQAYAPRQPDASQEVDIVDRFLRSGGGRAT